MGLGISTESGGDFTPFLKYDARAGRWFRKGDRDKGEQAPVDVTNNFTAVFDFATIEVGWIDFPAGAAPIQLTRPISEGIPPKPEGGKFKQGFRMRAALPGHLGGGVYEVSSTAKAMIGAIDALHTAFTESPEGKAGKLPVVAMTGTTVVETSGPKGTTRNYQPVLVVQSWVPRPPTMPLQGFSGSAQVQPSPTVNQAPPATGSTQVAPPAPKPVPAPAADLAFG